MQSSRERWDGLERGNRIAMDYMCSQTKPSGEAVRYIKLDINGPFLGFCII